MEVKGLGIITVVSVVIILGAFFAAWGYIIREKRSGQLISKRRWIEQLPSLISTLGVLGTFIGITIGLYFFNTADLDHSIPKLLEGLKTAFFTSLAGMIGSLILSKIVNSSFDENDGGVSDINLAAGEICKAVGELREQIKLQMQEQSSFYRNVSYSFDKINKGTDELVGAGAKWDNMELLWNSFLNIARSQEGALNVIKEKLEETQASLGNIEEHGESQKRIVETLSEKVANIDNQSSESLEALSGIFSTQEEMSAEIKKFSEVLRGEVDEIEGKMAETNELLTRKFDEFSELLKKSNTEALVAVLCLNNGVGIETLAKMMGHTDIKTTQIYAKVLDEQVEQAFDDLEARLNR